MGEQSMKTQLLPCPFCGGEAELRTGRAAEDAEFAYVRCKGCLVSTDQFEDAYAPIHDAIWRWNHRTPPAAVPDGWQPTPDMIERVAKATCREQCAFMGEPPCWQVDGLSPDCDEPGCLALAEAAISAMLSAAPAAPTEDPNE